MNSEKIVGAWIEEKTFNNIKFLALLILLAFSSLELQYVIVALAQSFGLTA